MAHGAQAEAQAGHELSFWRKYIFSQDHKVIGIQYALTSMFMAVLGGLLARVLRPHLGWPGQSWPLLGRLFPSGMPDGQMNQAFYLASVTMHGTIMIFFVLTTLLTGGFGNFLIPLMIGARDLAFPFLNMLSYWLYPPATRRPGRRPGSSARPAFRGGRGGPAAASSAPASPTAGG